MRISDWSSDVCSSDLPGMKCRLQALGLSLCFVLGFSTVFVLMGASATVLGQRLNDYRYEFNIVAGVVVIGFGLFLTGLIRPAWMMRDARWHSTIAGGHPADRKSTRLNSSH